MQIAFRSEKKNCEGPDATPSSWKYYAIVDRILGPMTNGEKSETPEDAEDGENSDFEELPEGFTFVSIFRTNNPEMGTSYNFVKCRKILPSTV